MILLQPRSTRPDPLLPSTPLFRSLHDAPQHRIDCRPAEILRRSLVQADDRVGRLALDTQMVVEGEPRSEEHTSELQSLMRISYAVFCLKKKNTQHIKKTVIYT